MSKVNHRASALSSLFTEEGQDSKVRRGDRGEKRVKKVERRPRMVNYKFDENAQASPKVGETVAIRHRSQAQKEGGSVRLVRDTVQVRTIGKVYLSDSTGYNVADHTGESWHIRPSAMGNAKWETFNQGEGRKEVK